MRNKEKTIKKVKTISKAKTVKSRTHKPAKTIVIHPQSVLHKHKKSWGDYMLKNVRSKTKKDKWGGYELESVPASKEVPNELHEKSVDAYQALEEHLVREVMKREGQEDIWLGESGWDYSAMFYDPEEKNVNFEFTYYGMDGWRTLDVEVYPDRYEVKISIHIDKDETESGREANFTPYHRKNVKKLDTVVRSINMNMYVDWAASK